MRIADREISFATVVGFGRTGKAVTDFLHSQGISVFVTESRSLSPPERESLESRNIGYEENLHSSDALMHADLLVLSPGVDPKLPIVVEARQRCIHTLPEMDLAYLVIPKRPVVAVSGTNGKGTVVTLIGAILNEHGVSAAVAGNVGTPFISVSAHANLYDVLVLEVSSYQLEQSTFLHPQVAVLLNITPDHLDRHRTMDAYIAAKLRLFQNQTKSDTAVLHSNLADMVGKTNAKQVFFDQVALPATPVVDALKPHERANLQAALAACTTLVPKLEASVLYSEAVQQAFRLPFRLEVVGRVHDAVVVNDSKSTNADATIAALASFTAPIVLLLGGHHKTKGYDALASSIFARDVRHVILYGEAADFLRRTLETEGYSRTTVCSNLEDAVRMAIPKIEKGDILLFSPACSSFDQYTNYVERGEHFNTIARALEGFAATPPSDEFS